MNDLTLLDAIGVVATGICIGLTLVGVVYLVVIYGDNRDYYED
jgi:hypothetical protein